MNGCTSSAKKGGGLIKKNYPYRFDHLFEKKKLEPWGTFKTKTMHRAGCCIDPRVYKCDIHKDHDHCSGK